MRILCLAIGIGLVFSAFAQNEAQKEALIASKNAKGELLLAEPKDFANYERFVSFLQADAKDALLASCWRQQLERQALKIWDGAKAELSRAGVWREGMRVIPELRSNGIAYLVVDGAKAPLVEWKLLRDKDTGKRTSYFSVPAADKKVAETTETRPFQKALADRAQSKSDELQYDTKLLQTYFELGNKVKNPENPEENAEFFGVGHRVNEDILRELVRKQLVPKDTGLLFVTFEFPHFITLVFHSSGQPFLGLQLRFEWKGNRGEGRNYFFVPPAGWAPPPRAKDDRNKT
jgi:hypothetical protein